MFSFVVCGCSSRKRHDRNLFGCGAGVGEEKALIVIVYGIEVCYCVFLRFKM